MNQKTSAHKKNTNRIILSIAVVAVLIIAPLGSFLFLQKGYNYRIESLNQLKPKGLSAELTDFIVKNAPFKGNARLIHIPGDTEAEEDELLRKIDDKIVDRARFDIISFGQDLDQDVKHDINYHPVDLITDFEEQFVLIDTSDVVRATYKFIPGVEKEIIRHLAVVIPVPTSRSINLNRERK